MKIIGTIIAILLLIGLIAFNIFALIIGDIDVFIEKMEKEYKDSMKIGKDEDR